MISILVAVLAILLLIACIGLHVLNEGVKEAHKVADDYKVDWELELRKNQALETELKTLKKQLQETAEDEAKQVHGKVFQARIYEKATPDVYQAVFEYTTNGQRVMQDLVNRFCGSAYTSDQNGGERETCRKLGQSEVVSHINRQIYIANNPDVFKQHGVDDE